MPDPGQPMQIGVPKMPIADPVEFEWTPWPTGGGRLPEAAFTENGLAITSYAKLRPCLVLTPDEEIDTFQHVLVLPISTVKPRGADTDLLRANQVPHRQFLPGEPRLQIEDGEVDFRWSWRLHVGDLRFGTHEADLHPELLVRLLLRFRDYLYSAPV